MPLKSGVTHILLDRTFTAAKARFGTPESFSMS